MRTRATALALPALLLLAAAPRFLQLDLISITADEGIHGLAADQVSRLLTLPQAGPPSVGIHNTPCFIYTLSAPLFFVREALAGAAFVAGLQMLALALAWHWGTKWFGRGAAAIGCVLLATSPWMVLYARNMWPPSAVMPLGIALVGLGCDWLRGGGNWRLCGVAALTLLLPAMHFSGFAAPVWSFGVLLAGRTHLRSWRAPPAVAAGLALGLLPWLPWLYFQHFQAHWIDLRALRSNAAGKAEFSAWALPEYFQALLHAGGLRYWFNESWADMQALRPAGTAAWQTAGAATAWAMLGAALWQARQADALRRALWAWTLAPPMLLLALRPALHPHYLLIAFPVPFLLLGDAAARWARTPPRRLALATGLAALVVGNLMALETIRRFLDADLLHGVNRYQLTYRQRRAAAAAAVDDAGPRQVEIAGYFNGREPSYSWLHYLEIARRGGLRWPADPTLLYWMDESPDDPLGPSALAVLRETAPHFAGAAVERVWRVGPTRLVRLRAAPGTIAAPAGRP